MLQNREIFFNWEPMQGNVSNCREINVKVGQFDLDMAVLSCYFAPAWLVCLQVVVEVGGISLETRR